MRFSCTYPSSSASMRASRSFESLVCADKNPVVIATMRKNRRVTSGLMYHGAAGESSIYDVDVLAQAAFRGSSLLGRFRNSGGPSPGARAQAHRSAPRRRELYDRGSV